MDLQLIDKVGVVTGASRGIGRAIAQALAGEGMRLVLVARSQQQLEDLAASLPSPCLVQAADLRDADAPAAVVAAAVSRFGRLDLLVNNAGATTRGDFLALTDVDWQDGFALKFFGAMR
jgi:3-oxoacyl-[acyl-carrier protein] reductase